MSKDKKNNTGYENSGIYNSGIYNSGNSNSGSYNSGDWNSGNSNPGYGNSGNRNSGYGNSGYYNSGSHNSGDGNSGDGNSGNYNSGSYNSGHLNSGYFNTTEPTVRLFNKETNLKKSQVNIPHIDLLINEWVPEDKMSDEQKKADPNFFVKKGTLITRSYKEAFKMSWDKLDSSVKDQFLNLPNFDSKIFEEITGINVNAKINSCNGKLVEIDGKKYKLTEIE